MGTSLKAKICGIFCFFSFVLLVYAQDKVENISTLKDLSELVNSSVLAELKEKGRVQNFFYGSNNAEIKISPNTELSEQARTYWQRDKKPVFLVESLYAVKKDDNVLKNSDDTHIGKISKVVRNLSKMKGMEYYSTSRARHEVLYTDVYTVINPENPIAIDDPINLPLENLVSYVYQKDRSLGGCIYQFNYFKADNEISFRALNTEKIVYKGFSIVKPENLVLTLIVIEAKEDIIFYILVQADVVKIPFLSAKLARSFGSRADAIYEWCLQMYKN